MLSVFSSYANDRITYRDSIVMGGPALWIEKALQNLEKPYEVITGANHGEVLISRGSDGEDIGMITSTSAIPFGARAFEKVLVSTLAHEFNLEHLRNIHAPVFLDVQGYTRSLYGGPRTQVRDNALFDNILYLKATEKEYSYLDPRLIHRCMQKPVGGLIVTRGGDAISLFSGGVETRISLVRYDYTDTIGAGDTFFAYFSAQWHAGIAVPELLAHAAAFTQRFLRSKNS